MEGGLRASSLRLGSFIYPLNCIAWLGDPVRNFVLINALPCNTGLHLSVLYNQSFTNC